MEIQFEQNKKFNQSHRDDHSVTDTRDEEKRQPQGKEGDPNIRLKNREALQTEKTELDRRPYDIVQGDASSIGDESTSAVAGIKNDQQDSASGDSRPLGGNTEEVVKEDINKFRKSNDGN